MSLPHKNQETKFFTATPKTSDYFKACPVGLERGNRLGLLDLPAGKSLININNALIKYEVERFLFLSPPGFFQDLDLAISELLLLNLFVS